MLLTQNLFQIDLKFVWNRFYDVKMEKQPFFYRYQINSKRLINNQSFYFHGGIVE